MDHRLSIRKRLVMWVHLSMCSLCSRFRRQLAFLAHAARTWRIDGEQEYPHAPRLSPEARSRIRQALERGSA
jgi:hypothetical protein